MHRQKKISRDLEYLNSTYNQLTLLDNYRTLYSSIAEYTFYKTSRLFTKVNNVLGHKSSLNKLQSIEIICIN